MGMRVEETLNAAAGVFESMTENKIQKTQKAFASFMDNAAKSNANITTGGADKYISAAVSDAKQKSGSDDSSANNQSVSDKNVVKSGNKANDSKTTEKAVDKSSEDLSAQNVSTENVTVEEEQVVSEIENAILSMLAQELGITVEEVSQILDDMGMSAIDLLDSSNLLEFTMQINGVDDIGAVLTDENLMTQYKELTEELQFTVENVLKDNDIPVKDLPQLLENVKANNATELNVKEENVTVDVKGSDNVQSTDELADTKIVVENNKNWQEENSFSQQHSENENQGIPMGMQTQNHMVNTVVDALNNAQISYAAADMEEIVNQIVEQIKVQVNADTSSMEMQLNPESYGKLQLQVALKDGMVTAQMTVENEAVRHALEMQIVQLRESMNSQGLKVEAIEVTVASHEFDRNLQQESDANQQAFEEEQKKSAVRRMNLNLNAQDWVEEDLEELSDAEALERKIMLESGNRMSIQA